MGCGGVFPLVLALVGDRYSEVSGTAFGVALTMALMGGMLLPFVTGALGSAFGMRAALVIVPVGLVCSIGLYGMVRGSQRRPIREGA
jgi:fucose permease